jgi:hypothetical protein
MPFPVAWFKGVDPFLPYLQNIKPFLYAWDEYQTYDALWAGCFPLEQYKWFYWSLNYHLPLPNIEDTLLGERWVLPLNKPDSRLILIERFTPWDYPWAEGYSTELFKLLKRISFDIIPYQGGGTIPYFFIPTYYSIPFEIYKDYDRSKLLVSQFLPSFVYTYPQKFTFSFSLEKAQTIVLTWLEMTTVGLYTGYAREVLKRYKIFKLDSGKRTITLRFNLLFCAGSLVVSGTGEVQKIERAIEIKEPGVLYKNLFLILKDIEDEFFVKQFNFYRPKILGDTILYDWFYYAALTYANNNHWGNRIGVGIDKDLGKPIYFNATISDDGLATEPKFYLWGNGSLVVAGDFKGRISNELGTPIPKENPIWRKVQSNLVKRFESIPYQGFVTEFFSETEVINLEKVLESLLLTKGEALGRNTVISLIDDLKKQELLENA